MCIRDSYNTIDAPAEYFATIKQGMQDVVNSDDELGSASSVFKGWEYAGQIGGKTGSGQVSEIELENNAWFVAFAPYDDPQIAVVSYIPNGYSGASAAPAAKSILQYYLDGLAAVSYTHLDVYKRQVQIYAGRAGVRFRLY